jgi:hypothetical protein
MLEEIIKMTNNIGSLSLFLNNPKNIEYLKYLNSNIPKEIINLKTSEKLFYLVNSIKKLIVCDCGDKRSFIGFKNGYRSTCGKKSCFIKKRKETCIDKYGVDNPKKSKEIIEKEKKGIIDRWNGQHYMLNKVVKNKFKKTMIIKWGVEWAQQSSEIRNKSLSTWSNNPNRDLIIEERVNKLVNKSEEEKNNINEKKLKSISDRFGSYDSFIEYRLECIKNRSLEKYGLDHHFKSNDIKTKRVNSYKKNILDKIKCDLPDSITFIDKKLNKNKTDTIIDLFCKNCQFNFRINRQLFLNRKSLNEEICLKCNPILSGRSKREIEVEEFIKENYDGDILLNSKNIISKEVDIYLPNLKLAFEFNGLYWHSDLYKDKNYHLDKTNKCLYSGIQLIHIWEDDWDFKKDIVKSIILNKLNISKKIWARKCEIREIKDNRIVRKFLEDNHIQGFVGSKTKIGLFFNDELVSLMTFGNLRRSLGSKSNVGSHELLRFCNKLNISVIGGASRLLNYFIKNYKLTEIISYSDNSRGTGELYKRMGFELVSETEPNYYWVIDGIRRHRFNFRKDKLVKEGADVNKTELEIMTERGYYRIFDCGSKKWRKVNVI